MQGERAIKETGIGLAGKREGRDAEERDCRKKRRVRDESSREPPKKEVELILGSGAGKFPGNAVAWLT
jgi:hypothetical protein